MKTTLFAAIFALLLSWTVEAQGPPVRITAFTVEKSVKFKTIPVPKDALEVSKYASEAGTATGMVNLHFPNAKAGKFKKGAISLHVRNNTVTSVTLEAKSAKAVKGLMKQMNLQFGDPYKLEVRDGKHLIAWHSRTKSSLGIAFSANQEFTEATVQIDRL